MVCTFGRLKVSDTSKVCLTLNTQHTKMPYSKLPIAFTRNFSLYGMAGVKLLSVLPNVFGGVDAK